MTTALHEDDAWVLGATTAQEDKQQIDNAVRQLYMRDFIVNWIAFSLTFSSTTAPIFPSVLTPLPPAFRHQLAAAPSGA